MMIKTFIFVFFIKICMVHAFMTCTDKRNNVVVSKAAIPKLHKIWQPREVKYAIYNYPQEMSYEETEIAITDAFAQWSSIIPIEFRDVSMIGEIPNIKIYFNFSICQVYAFSVVTDRTVFNSKFKWAYWDSGKILSGNYIDLNKIALHEIGHHLGIPDDYGRYGSVMHTNFRPTYDKLGNYVRPTLGIDDIENAQMLYGARNGAREPFRRRSKL